MSKRKRSWPPADRLDARGQPKVSGPIAPNSIDLGVLKTGHVVLQFAELTQHMTFTPDQARKIGQGFIEMATKCEILYPAGGIHGVAANSKSRVF